MNVARMEKKPNISYMTYGEIVKLALDNKYAKNASGINPKEQLDFAEQLVVDINVAIEDREIIPVTIKKSSSYIGDYEYYKNRIMQYALVAIPIGFIAISKYLWDRTDLKASILMEDPGIDLPLMVINICLMIAVSALVPLLVEVFKYIKVRIFSLKTDSPTGMIKYQLQEAKYRGYTEAGYYTNSVVEFLNSRYGLNVGAREQRNPPENSSIAAKMQDTTDDSGSWSTRPEFREGGVLKLVFAPRNAKRDKQISEEMSRIAQIRHSSRNAAKERIGEFIKREIAPPCTCYHNQIARYIVKMQGSEGFDAPLDFIDVNGEKKKISETDLREVAKREMKAYDPSRVCDRTMKLELCKKHRVK